MNRQENALADVRYVQRAPFKEPYLAVVNGRHVYRRMNESMPQFEARVDHAAARQRESGWRL